MVDEIKNLASSISDLNKVTPKAAIEFQGLAKTITKSANSFDGAGRNWNIFSRLVSGSPLWSIQNKVRAYIGVIGMMEKRSQLNSEAQMRQNEIVIEQVQSYQKLKPELEKLNKFKDAIGKGIPFGDAEAKKSIEEAVNGTLAYNKALLEGIEPQKAFAAGLDELIGKGNLQAKMFTDAQKKITDAKRYETSGTGGRGDIQKEITDRRAQYKKSASVNAEKIFKSMSEKLTSLKKFATGNYSVLEKSEKRQKKIDKMTRRAEKREILALKINQGVFKVTQMVKPLLNYVFKFLVFSIFAFMGLLIFLKFAKDAFDILTEMGVFDELKSIFYVALEMIGAFFGLIGAFINGDYEMALDYLMTLLDGAISIIMSVFNIIWKTALGLAVGFFYTIIDNIHLLLKPEFWKRALPILKKFGMILLAAYFIKYMIAQVALLIGIYALPIIVIGLIGALLMAFWKKVSGDLPFFANGGVSAGGMAVVGERGPELVNLPKGSRVHSNRDSKKMVASSGGNTINITINARDTSDAELRRIADKIGNMVNNKINRRTSSRTLG
jgi:hypothetical protein